MLSLGPFIHGGDSLHSLISTVIPDSAWTNSSNGIIFEGTALDALCEYPVDLVLGPSDATAADTDNFVTALKGNKDHRPLFDMFTVLFM